MGNLLFASGLTDAAEHAVQISFAGVGELPQRKQAVNRLHSRPLLRRHAGLRNAARPASHPHATLQQPGTTDPEKRLADLMTSQANTIIDLGEDEFTQGRLHPMMDNDLRLRRLRQETADPDVDLIVLDVVLGEGAHPDPAAEFAPAIAAAKQPGKRIVAIVVGTEDDPQDLNSQIERLAAAGATVFPNVNEALDYVYNRLPPVENAYPPVSFGTEKDWWPLTFGLESFYDSIKAQGGTAVHVDWRPPAGGNEQLMAILAKMKKK